MELKTKTLAGSIGKILSTTENDRLIAKQERAIRNIKNSFDSAIDDFYRILERAEDELEKFINVDTVLNCDDLKPFDVNGYRGAIYKVDTIKKNIEETKKTLVNLLGEDYAFVARS